MKSKLVMNRICATRFDRLLCVIYASPSTRSLTTRISNGSWSSPLTSYTNATPHSTPSRPQRCTRMRSRISIDNDFIVFQITFSFPSTLRSSVIRCRIRDARAIRSG